MKLELDLNDKNALLAKREEFRRGLAVIDAALLGMGSNSIPQHIDVVEQPKAPPISRPEPETILAALPHQFQIGQILADPAINRPAARRMILDWVNNGRTRVHERRRGSSGSVYEKVT